MDTSHPRIAVLEAAAPPRPHHRPSSPVLYDTVLNLITATGWADAASITPAPGSTSSWSAGAKGGLAIKADELQHLLGEGPAVTASSSQTPVTVDDLSTDRRWPSWTPQALGLGLRAVLIVPLPTTVGTGSVNLYSEETRLHSDADVQRAILLAEHVAAIVAHDNQVRHLTRAIDARTVIGQAQGILVERRRISPAQAFEVLRRYSQLANIKLSNIAAALVRTGLLPKLMGRQQRQADSYDDRNAGPARNNSAE